MGSRPARSRPGPRRRLQHLSSRAPTDVVGRRQVRASDPKTAQTPPERNGRERAAEALYRLGLLQADPTSGIRDYRAARATFTRLLSDYPRCRWGAEARAWQATLTDLLVREDEARRALLQLKRYEDESKRTKTNLEWLKQTDIELERRGR
jgi:hypothetical protein